MSPAEVDLERQRLDLERRRLELEEREQRRLDEDRRREKAAKEERRLEAEAAARLEKREIAEAKARRYARNAADKNVRLAKERHDDADLWTYVGIGVCAISGICATSNAIAAALFFLGSPVIWYGVGSLVGVATWSAVGLLIGLPTLYNGRSLEEEARQYDSAAESWERTAQEY